MKNWSIREDTLPRDHDDSEPVEWTRIGPVIKVVLFLPIWN